MDMSLGQEFPATRMRQTIRIAQHKALLPDRPVAGIPATVGGYREIPAARSAGVRRARADVDLLKRHRKVSEPDRSATASTLQ